MDNNILTLLLNFNDAIVSFKKLSASGKQISTKICDILTEENVLKNGLHQKNETTQSYLYKYALEQISISKSQEINNFEQAFLEKIRAVSTMIKKVKQLLQKYQFNQKWLNDSNPQYRMGLFQIVQIMEKLGDTYLEHVDFCVQKWAKISEGLFKNADMREEMKYFLLHISFQSFVDNQLLQNWINLLSQIQTKRHK